MLIDEVKKPRFYRWLLLAEGGLILAAIPFLLYTTIFPILTGIIMLLLAINWLAQAIMVRRPMPATPTTQSFWPYFDGCLLAL